MTRAEALAEAKRRWPISGTVDVRNYEVFPGFITKVYSVGATKPPELPPHGWAHGSADSWEAAFADADRRAK